MYVNVYLPSFTFSGSFITLKFIWILYFFMIFELTSIVFRSRPVQGPGFGFWSSHRVGRVNFFKSKQRRFSKKTKVNGLQSGFWSSLPGSHRVFSYPIFSSTRSGSSLGSTRRAGPGFKTMCQRTISTQ